MKNVLPENQLDFSRKYWKKLLINFFLQKKSIKFVSNINKQFKKSKMWIVN